MGAKSLWSKVVCLICVFALMLSLSTSIVMAENEDQTNTDTAAEVQTDDEIQPDLGKTMAYINYLQYFKEKFGENRPDTEILLETKDITDTTGTNFEIRDFYADAENKSVSDVYVWSNEEGKITYTVNIKESGFYNMSMYYCPVVLKGRDIELSLYIDGEIPFSEAQKLLFKRTWIDNEEIQKDAFDNDVRPEQAEKPIWLEDTFRDKEGFSSDDFLFYFEEGVHTISIEMVKEAAAIKYIKLFRNKDLPAYEEVLAGYKKNGYKNAENQTISIEAEHADFKSDSVLFARNDRTSPLTYPYHHSRIRLNTIGQSNWNLTGMWVEYNFDVAEEGLYQINLRVKQSYQIGMPTMRKIYIDGEVPFKELQSVQFPYDDSWYVKTLGIDYDKNADPYLFYFEEGPHTIRIEATVGDYGEILSEINDIAYMLNDMYRKVIMVTSTDPDIYHDYLIDKQIPELVPTFEKCEKRLKGAADKFIMLNEGKNGEQSALLIRIADQLKSFNEDMYEFPSRLSAFRDSISALSAWILARKEQPLEIDVLEINTPGIISRKGNANFWQTFVHNLKAFWASFFDNYNTISDTGSGSIKVWIWGGRDQAQIINTMVTDMFVSKTGIKVDISLVQSGLIEAILAGKAPDIALGIGRADPVNLASRKALIGLKDFDTFEEVTKRFAKTAMNPYEFNGDYYAIPLTNTFPMMFYRTDIFEELGLEPPQTWKELNDIIPILQRNSMTTGLPSGMMYPIFLLQNGGNYYNEAKNQTRFNEQVAIDSFKQWTDYYSKYSFDLQFDLYNRFRSGEMPIGLADYTLFNQLSVAAPEIRNQWTMVPIPGTLKEDGTIDRSTGAGGTCAVIIRGAKRPEDCWKFVDYWSNTEAQTRFGRELESLLGAAGRYATANLEAFEQLPWSKKEIANLLSQWEWVNEIPEVVGGYYTGRELDFKFREVVYDHVNTREALYRANENINNEINRKRRELKLDVYGE